MEHITTKVVRLLRERIRATGLEPVQCFDIDFISIQRPDRAGELLGIRHRFDDHYYDLTLTVGGRVVPSVDGRDTWRIDYADFDRRLDGFMAALDAALASVRPLAPCPEPTVGRYLSLSTAHLDAAATSELDLSSSGEFPSVLAVSRRDRGWLCYAQEDFEELMAAGAPASIVAIFRYARGLGCDYVIFDGDAPADPRLPTFDQA